MLMLAPILELFACLFKDFANPECWSQTHRRLLQPYLII
jgi:hypothetical protein